MKMSNTAMTNSARLRTVGLILLPLLLITVAGCGSSDTGDGQWTLEWSDEFEGPAGRIPDASKWAFEIGTDWGNNQLEYDTNRPENASLDGSGNLAIIAREESRLGSDYTSARIITRGLFEQQYGRFEARIRLPTGQGIWPAFWLLGNNISTVGWPQCGEIDIMEYRGQEPSRNHGSLHGPGYSGGNPLSETFELAGSRFDADFHIFAIEWVEDNIRWYVDDNLYHSVRTNDVPGDWVYDHPFFIILNVAVGGGFVGPPNGSTVFPQTMLVDYVRVYSADA